jgi:mRNA-degrading endonuclease toxin of MazEF toxin-antitoxin module
MAYSANGSAFRVNTQTIANQDESDSAVLSSGGFVVVWEDDSEPLGNGNIKGQLYDASAHRVGSEFVVNTQTSGNQILPAVTGFGSGLFVATWTDGSGIGDGDLASVEGQIFDATGTKIGSEFVVNTQRTSTQAFSEIAPLTTGGFVITWSDAVGPNVKAQIYAANGTKLGGELTVDTEGYDFREPAAVAGLANGGFVIAFEQGNGVPGSGSTDSIKAQFFDATGAKIGREVLANTTTPSITGTPAIAALNDGHLVICWEQDIGEIEAQLFDANGSKVGTEFQVNTKTQFGQYQPSIAALADGGFVISWSDTKELLNGQIKAQVFDAAGAKAGGEFLVSPPSSFNQVESSIAGFPSGDFLVTWTDFSATLGDTSGSSVQAQLYQFVHTTTVHWMQSVSVGPHPAGWLPAAFADFTADGTSDVLWYNAGTTDAEAWKIANGNWAGSVDIGTHPAGYQIAGTGDFNHDGTSDVLWVNPASNATDIWLLNNGGWAGSTTIGTHPAGYQVAGVGDFNQDGTSDVLWYNPATQDTDIWLVNNGHWAGSSSIGIHPAGYQVAGTGDFNHDGTSDVLWVNPATNATDIWLVNNGHWAGSTTIGTHPAGYQISGVGDFNHDGTSDVVWYNPSTNDVDVWLVQNGHWIGSVDVGAHPAGSQLMGIGDFDHNGISDVMWRDANSNSVETWLLAYS